MPGTSVINGTLKLIFVDCVIFNLPWYLRFTVGYRFLDEKGWQGTRSVEALVGLSFFLIELSPFLKVKSFYPLFLFQWHTRK